MDINNLKKKEIIDYLSIFGITPIFNDNKLEVLIKKEGLFKRFFKKDINSMAFSQYIKNKMIYFILYDQSETIMINKDSNSNISIQYTKKGKKYLNNHYIYPQQEIIASESRLTIIGNYDKTVDFKIYNEGEIIFKIIVSSTKSLDKYEYVCKNELLLPDSFKSIIKNKFDFTETELEIVLKYILMRIENIYQDLIANQYKYQKRFNRPTIKVIEDYENNFTKKRKKILN